MKPKPKLSPVERTMKRVKLCSEHGARCWLDARTTERKKAKAARRKGEA